MLGVCSCHVTREAAKPLLVLLLLKVWVFFVLNPHPRMFLLLLEREEGREKSIGCLPNVPQLGIELQPRYVP